MSHLSPTSNGFDHENIKVTKFNVPHDNTNVDYGYAKVQISTVDREKIIALERKLNDRFEKKIAEEVENMDKKKTKKERDDEKGKDDSNIIGPTSWSLTSHIVSFLTSSIQNIERTKLKL